MSGFPTIVQDALALSLAGVSGVTQVVKRGPRGTDGNGTVGIKAAIWTPGVLVIGQPDPLVSKYDFLIAALTKHSDPIQGFAIGAELAKAIRIMLYRDNTLRIRLGGLQETTSGVIERTQRWGVLRQTFDDTNDKSTFVHLSLTNFWLETETS